ncbi:MAG: insulinase family protein [Aureispira sp.]|nr:insulinase family protein [Aureispira sp.]
MIKFERYKLANGLTLIVHPDVSTPLVSVCLTYKVGTRNEQPERTGFAHLFEHLMFGGSKNAPRFDDHIQQAGGENNAFTNQDITVYYDIVPKDNIELALWLEADRMLNLNLDQQSLDIQRKVVIEEFKEVCINEPYGDIWHHMGPLAYKNHPYSIPTIGKTFKHIEDATLGDVKAFFDQYYCPNNAILTISGDVEPLHVLELVKKWFGDIPSGNTPTPQFPAVNLPKQHQHIDVEANVPLNGLYLAFYSANRLAQDYYADDLLSDILAEGETSRLYDELVKKQQLFSDLDAYITGTIDQGLLVIEGKLSEDISFQEAEDAIWELLERLKTEPLNPQEFKKLLNCVEHNLEFGETSHLHKAMSLGYYETLGDAHWINQEQERYKKLTPEVLQKRAQQVFQKNLSSSIYYKSVD